MSTAPERFHTARLAAEPIGMGRFAELAAMNRDLRVMEWLGGAAADDEETRVWIEEKDAHWRRHGFGVWVLWTMRRPAPSSAAPVCSTRTWRAWTRWSFSTPCGRSPGAAAWPPKWAQRLLGIAFSVLELPSVVAYTLPDNVRSRRVMEKLGFVYEREFASRRPPARALPRDGDPRGSDGGPAAQATAGRDHGRRPPT